METIKMNSDDYQKLIDTIDKNTTTLLEISVTMSKKDARIKILNGFVDQALLKFEYHFDSDPSQFDYEQLEWYCASAKYLYETTGRTNIIEKVKTEMFNISLGNNW